MRVYSTSRRTSLAKVAELLSSFVGTVEDMSPEDIKEFEVITGFKLADLLESYSSLVNTLESK